MQRDSGLSEQNEPRASMAPTSISHVLRGVRRRQKRSPGAETRHPGCEEGRVDDSPFSGPSENSCGGGGRAVQPLNRYMLRQPLTRNGRGLAKKAADWAEG